MLSIAKVADSGAATYYYARDNYYANDGEALRHSLWRGRGAETLGLKGEVDKPTFAALMEGRLPDGRELGRVVNGERKHVAGYDLTFSAPKSVSVLAEMLDRTDLRDAHREAVQTALDYAERHVIETRIFNPQTRRQETVGDQKAVFAVFEHNLSRAAEPDLHSHAVLANLAIGDDGTTRSVHSPSLFRNKMLLDAIYRAELAANLRKFGFEIEQTHKDGRFEIRGFPKDLKYAFSTRRRDIEKALKEGGYEGAEHAARAAIITRAAKGDVDQKTVCASWRERSEGLGYNVEALARDLKNDRQGRTSSRQAQEAVTSAIDHLSERSAAFREQDLIRQAIGFSLGRARVNRILEAIRDAKKEGRLLASERTSFKAYVTTREAAARETKTLELARNGRRATLPIANIRTIEQRLRGRSLEHRTVCLNHSFDD